MIKKLSMIIVGVTIVTLCGMAIPQNEAKADDVIHRIYHEVGGEQGQTAIRTTHRTFWTTTEFPDSRGTRVSMGWISRGWTTAVAIMKCGGYDSVDVNVPRRSIEIHLRPRHRR